MENRHGLAVESRVTTAGGTRERQTAPTLTEAAAAGTRRITLGADRGYDTREFVENLRFLNVTPHVAQNDRGRRSAIDRRTTRHAGYALSQRRRKRVDNL